MPTSLPADTELLQTALTGLQYKIAEVDRRIAEVRAELGTAAVSKSSASPAGGTPVRKRRSMSAATKKRMAAAQRARWKKYHAASKA